MKNPVLKILSTGFYAFSEYPEMHGTGTKDAENDAGDDLERGVAHEFFKGDFRQFVFGKAFEGIHKDIEELRVLAGFEPDAHGVVTDDDGKDSAYGKFKGTEAIGEPADGCK